MTPNICHRQRESQISPHGNPESEWPQPALKGQVQEYRRAKFGPKSEMLDPTQLELAPEDLETAIAETQAQIAGVAEKIAASASEPDKAAPRELRKARALPDSLPRVERMIEPDSIALLLRLRRHSADR